MHVCVMPCPPVQSICGLPLPPVPLNACTAHVSTSLSLSRVRIEDEDSVINYKVCRWSSLKIEGWSTADNDATSHNQLRMIVGASEIFISFKRNMSDSSIMCFRVVVSLGE